MSESERLPIGMIINGKVLLTGGIEIPIPESLEIGMGDYENFLVYCTPAGLLAFEINGKLRTRFDNIARSPRCSEIILESLSSEWVRPTTLLETIRTLHEWSGLQESTFYYNLNRLVTSNEIEKRAIPDKSVKGKNPSEYRLVKRFDHVVE